MSSCQEISIVSLDYLTPFWHSPIGCSNWHEFLKIILGLGYKSNELISSANNIANAYILFLIAKIKVGLTRKELERYIGKWFSFSSVTSRYSFSPESQMESDLNAFRTRDRAEFIKSLVGIIDSELE
jgi:hypothetical protein